MKPTGRKYAVSMNWQSLEEMGGGRQNSCSHTFIHTSQHYSQRNKVWKGTGREEMGSYKDVQSS